MRQPPYRFAAGERGAALIISLLMLMIMTIIAISISQTSTLEQRMAGNARDRNAAFETAEAGLRGGEATLNTAADAGTLTFCSDLTQCTATEILYFSGTDVSAQTKSWWTSNAIEYGTAGTQDLTEVAEDPRYIISLRAEVSDSLTVGGGPGGSKVIQYYEVTSHAYGVTDTAEAVSSAVIAIPKS